MTILEAYTKIEEKMENRTNFRMSYTKMYLLGFLIRICLTKSAIQTTIADRVEVSTPVNSWKKITEALYLQDLNIYPYDGDFLHELPLNLKIFQILRSVCKGHVYLVFLICDVATAYLLHLFTRKYFSFLNDAQNKAKHRYVENIEDILTREEDCLVIPKYVAVAYLFSPYTLFNCVGLTSTVFHNFFLAVFLNGLVYNNVIISTISLAICISQNLYCVLLISPMFLQFLLIEKQLKKAVNSLILVAVFWSKLMYVSYSIYNTWDFLYITYGFTLTAPDLRPNIGLFWYFFTEVFEHFRMLFLCAFQMNILLLYIVPLSIRFRKETLLLSFSLLSLITTFKPYPCIGDLGFVLSIVPCWKHLFSYTQQGFIVAGALCVTTALGPIFWYLWLYSGSANVNFYFGVTLAFGMAQIFLLTDLLFAYVKREFNLIYKREVIIDGKLCRPVLD